MASLAARLASAQKMARRAPIRATAIEREIGTRYTIDSLRALTRRYPRRRFIWIIGSDNLAQFHRWKDWRAIARLMPIAVVARPGYTSAAMSAPAMAWLRRFVRRADQQQNWTEWSRPALILLRFPPDTRSATAMRRADPHWFAEYAGRRIRDTVTRRILPADDCKKEN